MKLTEKISNVWTPMLYNTGIRLYRTAVALAALRNKKASLMRKGHKKVWDYLHRHIKPGEKYVWIHTSSLGEFEQGRPLMERLKSERPDLKILLTFFSPSGYEVRHSWPGADAVCYLPFDLPRHAEKFLNMVNPVAAIFVKYEFWRNFLLGLEKRRIPTFLISGIFRRNQVFFRSGGEWYRRLLHCFDKLMVQDDNSRRLLSTIGVDKVAVCGDTRFDRVRDILTSRRPIPLLEEFTHGSTMTLMAGSSWSDDEDIYIPWLKSHPEVKAVIAPHEFDNDRINRLLNIFDGEAISWSQAKVDPHALVGKRVFIMDCFGLLSAAYRYADMAYVGGGFGAGIHNINEAAVYGIPVFFGPNNAKFIEARELKECGGGVQVTSQSDFAHQADMMLDAATRKAAGKAASDYIHSKIGATDKVFNIIKSYLPESEPSEEAKA